MVQYYFDGARKEVREGERNRGRKKEKREGELQLFKTWLRLRVSHVVVIRRDGLIFLQHHPVFFCLKASKTDLIQFINSQFIFLQLKGLEIKGVSKFNSSGNLSDSTQSLKLKWIY